MKTIRNGSFLLLALSQLSYAGVVDTFGLGSRNSALGNSSITTDGGEYGAQGNPASLVYGKGTSLSIGYLNSNLKLDDSETFHSDSADSGIVSDPYSTAAAGNITGYTFGARLGLSDYLALGIAGIMPAHSLAKIQAVTSEESTYLHFNDRQQVPEIYTSVGIKLFDNLSIGGGVYYSAYASGDIQMSTSEDDTDARMGMDVVPTMSPFFGALWNQPLNRSTNLLIGATYKGEQDARSSVNIDVNMETPFGSLPIESTSQLVAFYQPAELTLGVALKNYRLNSYASVGRTFWSKYEAPEISLSGDIEDLSQDASLSSSVGLKDSMGYKVGLEAPNIVRGKNYGLTGRLGLEYHTSALKDNPGSVSILDSDRFVVGAGVGLEVKKIGTFITRPFNIELGLKWISLKDGTISQYNDEGELTDSANIGGNVFSVATGVSFEI